MIGVPAVEGTPGPAKDTRVLAPVERACLRAGVSFEENSPLMMWTLGLASGERARDWMCWGSLEGLRA